MLKTMFATAALAYIGLREAKYGVASAGGVALVLGVIAVIVLCLDRPKPEPDDAQKEQEKSR